MNIHNVQFIKSVLHTAQHPSPRYPEVAVVGRSNVGKSSFINVLFNRKNLAKTSSKPGKTRLINYFLVDERIYVVDLPGYGFARTSKSVQEQWKKNIEAYLKENEYLRLVFLLLDSRHNLLPIDQLMIEWLQFYQIGLVLIATKSDKVSNNRIRILSREITEKYPDLHIVSFSAKTKSGRARVLDILESIN
jgi:GTP-binding protein